MLSLRRFVLFFSGLLLSLLLWHPTYAQTETTPPLFSVARGFYTTPFDLVLTSDPPGAAIYYTTDGSTPTAVSTPYTTPIHVATTTAVRAIAIADGQPASPAVTHTYLFLADVIHQGNHPAGYPDLFAATDENGPYPADYEMDPEVVNDPAYSDEMDAALTSIPTLSIVTDIPNLFDPDTGIYYNALMSGREWERPTSVELIYPDGKQGFQVNAGIRTHGKGSRDPRISPKKSFRLYFRSEYGPGKLEFPLFDNPNAAVEFDKLVLRAGSNNKWTHWSTFQRPVALYMRDEFARRSQQAMGQVSPNGIYVQLYINGLYWGLYNIAERIDDVYASDYFGGNEADWDVIKPDDFGGQEAAEGNLLAWQTVSALAEEDLTIPANYQAVVDYVDLESLADYIILLHYIENTDWPERNWYAVRNRVSGGGFKFIVWDSELGLKDKNRNIIAEDYPNTPAHLFQRLRTNADFRMLFADRVYKHLFNDGALTQAEATARFVELTDLVYQPVVGESARWGDYRRDVYQRPDVGNQSPFELYTRDVHWVAQRDKMLAQYFPVRATNVISNYVGAGLYPTIAPPHFSQPSGAVTSGSVLTIDNNENGGQGSIYYTVDGSDPRLPGGNISPKANNGGDSVNVPIFNTVTVKARVRSGATWSAVQQATFFVSQDMSKLVINEIMYHPPDDTGLDGNEYEFLELLNTGSETLNLDNVTFAEGINYTFPPGATVLPGGFIVLASNATAFEAKYGFAPDGVYLDRLSNSGETVRLLDGLGGEIDRVAYTDQPPWPADPDGLGSSLELIDAQLDNSLPQNWKSSAAAGGTPGAPNSSGTTDPCATPPPVIVINEINYNSSDSFNPEDWVELYNPGETAVSLTNWVFQDESAGFTIPANTTLPPHGYLVLVRDQALFSTAFPAISNFLGNLPFGFSGGGERLRLLSPTGCIVDEVAYDDVAPWPPAADGTGPTLTLLNPALDNNNPASWVASAMTGGTPGAANFPNGPTDNYNAYLPLIVRK